MQALCCVVMTVFALNTITQVFFIVCISNFRIAVKYHAVNDLVSLSNSMKKALFSVVHNHNARCLYVVEIIKYLITSKTHGRILNGVLSLQIKSIRFTDYVHGALHLMNGIIGGLIF